MSLRPQKIPARPASPFDRIGGRPPISELVTRFYDLMESDPAYADLRAIHLADLADMRISLTDFLVGWMGGPRDWFDKRPGACIMSAHGAMRGIDQHMADQWMDCMTEAARPVIEKDPEFAETMLGSMRSMGRTMVMRAATAALKV